MDTGGESGGLGGLGGQGNGGERTAFILFTDIYRSSHLWEVFPKQYPAVLEQHNRTVEEIVLARSGDIIRHLGDGYAVLFDDAVQCADSAVAIQCAMAGAQALPAFSDGTELQVRVACHGGELRQLAVGRGYFGPPLNRASRICQVCHPGQALVSQKVQVFLDAQPVNTTLIDLGEHRLRDLAEPEHLFQLDHPGFALHEFPPLPTLASRPNNLIEQPNAFIGRAGELAELKEMLVGQAVARLQRLITITAPGGYGKSRLATQLCADLLEEYKHGVFEVLLAPVGDHNRIVGATADALGFQFYGKTDPEEQLIDYLREKELLISFDNFEHVMEGADLISSILKEAPGVQVVVTSREPLRLSGEQVYPLESLPVVVSDGGADIPVRDSSMLADTEVRPTKDTALPDAVVLFTDRAMLVKPSFALDDASLPQAQVICERLDGVPLAIELAAAWVDSYSLDELLAEMDQQLELTARMRDVPERHRSVRASLDWSYNLLSYEQRDNLRCLAVFKGGFFIEAVEAVLVGRDSVLVGRTSVSADINGSAGVSPAESNGGRDARPTQEPQAGTLAPPKLKHLRRRLAELCDKSWLFTREVEDKTRFFIRDAATREYAWEKLEETRKVVGQASVLAGQGSQAETLAPPENLYEHAVIAHVQYFSALMEQEGEKLHGQGQLEALNILGLELQNIYEALDTALNREDALLLLPFAKYLARYLDMVSRFLDALTWYERLKQSAEKTGSRSLQIHSQLGYGTALWRLSRYEEAEEVALRAKRLAEEAGDRESIAASLHTLGRVAYHKGRYDEAKGLHHESLAIHREIDDRYGIAASLNNLGLVAGSTGCYDEAKELYEESLAIFREIGNRQGIAASLNNLGLVAGSQGRFDGAKELYEESLAIHREIGERMGIANSLGNLGNVADDQGRYDDAEELLQESLAIRREIGDRWGISASLNNLGSVAHSQGCCDEARELFQESLAIEREIGDRYGIALALNNLAFVSIKLGRLADAPEFLEEALKIASDIDAQTSILELLVTCGLLMLIAGSKEGEMCNAKCTVQAAILLYAAQHHAEKIGFTFDPTEQADLDEGLEKVQGKKVLGDSGQGTVEIDQLKAQACAMSLDELVQYALAALAELKLETPRKAATTRS